MDYNINLGKHLLPLVVQVLKYCTCPQLRHYFQQPPRCSLWSLKPHIRQMWLKALLVILYKVSGLKKTLSILKFSLQLESYCREHLTSLQVKGTVENIFLWFVYSLCVISVSDIVGLSSVLLTYYLCCLLSSQRYLRQRYLDLKMREYYIQFRWRVFWVTQNYFLKKISNLKCGVCVSLTACIL